jgi:AcrR family transcriptional regulator
MTVGPASRNARALARAELVREIKRVARHQLTEAGAAALSIRAVTRELGMVSSAIYRYFPSRDDLLTALIIDTYDAVGDVAEQADPGRAAAPVARWLAITGAVRSWACAHVQEYALIFGSPVPGYVAPPDTIDAAARVPNALVGIIRDAAAADVRDQPSDLSLPPAVAADVEALRPSLAPGVPVAVIARAVMAWTMVIGAISFELFGHLQNVIHDFDAWFEHVMRTTAAELGLDQEEGRGHG